MRPWCLIAFLLLAAFSPGGSAATFTVNQSGDAGLGSLRQAVADANATPGLDVIQFNIPPGGPQIISLLSPGLSITAPLTIDGTTQPGFSGKPILILSGTGSTTPGLSIATSNCLFRGLVISNFTGHGIVLGSNARDNVIGGTNNGAGNLIVGNGSSGVAVLSGTNNAIRGNSIFANGSMGIDLGGDGISANDNRDPDGGPNQLQNFPLLTSATISSNSVDIAGSLNSRVSITFQIDFFANAACDSSGSGEGQVYLGSRAVTTSGTGTVTFNFTLTPVAMGRYLTATATDPLGNTSEFSPCLRAGSTIPALARVVLNTNNDGPGSLRQAILDFNERVTFGTNTVAFAIPGTNVHTIAPLSPLPALFDAVTLDGYTQSGASPNTLSNGFNARLPVQLDGSLAGSDAAGIVLRGDGSVLRGLALISFGGGAIQVLGARSNLIQGNLIGVDANGFPSGNGLGTVGVTQYPGLFLMDSPGTIIGGTNVSARNVISANGADGIRISGAASAGNQVLGNFIGTDSTGLVGFGNASSGIRLDGVSAGMVGGIAAGAGNLISWNGNGVLISLGVSNRVQGNLIGCDVTGTNALGNDSGIALVDTHFNQIGGTNIAARNIIVANGQGGLTVSGASRSNLIQGNFLGTDAGGRRELGNGAFGLRLDTGDGNQIGGLEPGAGNTIAFNGGNGVEIGDGLGNAILRNAIFDNDGLGIDLGGDGVTENDLGDTDTGPNALQNVPELASAVIYTNRTIVRGALRSRPGSYSIQLFENPTCDDSGSGEGRFFLTNFTAIVPAGGLVAINYTNGSLLEAGHFITATATDVSNNTSEFSACMKLVSFGSVDLAVAQEDSVDPVEVLSNVTYVITVTNSGPTNATGVVLVDQLPPALSFVSATTSQGSCSHAAGVVTCPLNTINQGAAATITVTVLAHAPGMVANLVSLTSSQVDNTPENNTASESTAVGIADLGASITDSPDPVLTGQWLTYAIAVTNRGPNPATGVLLTWLASPGTPSAEIFSATVSQGVVNLLDDTVEFGTIPVHGSALLTLKLVPLVTGLFELHAAVLSVETDLELVNNEVTASSVANAGSGVVQFGSADYTVRETGSTVEVTMVRVGGEAGTVSVGYATSNSTATAGNDFVSTTGTITFGPGETSTTFSVTVLDDTEVECNESFALVLFAPTGFPALVGRSRATVTIFEDDLPPHGTVLSVSVNPDHPPVTGNGPSGSASMSAEGHRVAFASAAGDLVSTDGNGMSDVFVRNLTNDSTLLVSVNRLGTGSGNAPSEQPALAAGGRSVAFASLASDLVTNNLPVAGNVFLRDLVMDRTMLVSVSTNPVNGANAVSQGPVLSSNGLAVAFTSSAGDLVTLPNPFSTVGVFVRNLAAATTRLVSVNRFGTGAANGASSSPQFSGDGRWVAFASEATDLVVADTNSFPDIFVRDLTNGITLLAGVRNGGTGSGNGSSCCASLSANGRWVVFFSEATDLLAEPTETAGNIFVRDLALGVTRLVSANTNGLGANGPCRNPVISSDGRWVAFASDGSDLVPGDTNGESDVFLRDLVSGTVTLISVNCDGSGPGNAGSDSPSLNEDAQAVAFLSLANNLAPGEFPAGHWQAFRRDLSAGTTELISVNQPATGGGDDSVTAVQISANGRRAVFTSAAEDLDPGDHNGASDVFSWTAPEPAASADLAVLVRPPVPLGPFGKQLRFEVTVSNLGPDIATGVILLDVVSGTAMIDSALVSQGSALVSGASVFVQFDTIAPHASASATLTVTPGDSFFVNSASTAGFENDNFPANNVVEQTVTCPATDLLLEQAFLPNPAGVAGPIHFTLSISNRGSLPATGVSVQDFLPVEWGFISATSASGACTLGGHEVNCTLEDLAPHGRALIDIVVQAGGPGTFTNRAQAISASCDPLPANNTNAVVVQVVAATRPLLSIQNAAGNVMLAWPPETGPGFVLETATNLGPFTAWLVITNATSPYAVTNSPADRSRFYRLKMP